MQLTGKHRLDVYVIVTGSPCHFLYFIAKETKGWNAKDDIVDLEQQDFELCGSTYKWILS